MSKTIYSKIYNPNGNFLFTLDQLNAAKTNDKCLSVRCLKCGNIFYISRKQYACFLRDNKSAKYCSVTCSHQRRSRQLVTKPCLFCGCLVTKPACEAKKYPNFFCNSSHAASYNNRHRITKRVKSQPKTANTARARNSKRPSKPCKVCGQLKCERPDVCKSRFLSHKSPNLQKLGFDITSFGSQRVYEE